MHRYVSDAPRRAAAAALVLAVAGLAEPASAQTRTIVGAVWAAEDSTALAGARFEWFIKHVRSQ